eukprot:206804_1
MALCLLLSLTFISPQIVSANQNDIVSENAKQGTPSNEWDINGAGDRSIQGYAVPFSINIDESIEFRINTSSTKWKIDIYRVGYYQGHGARKIITFIQKKPSLQPDCIELPEWNTVTCNNWSPTLHFDTTSLSNQSLISGVYFARLTRLDVTNAQHSHYNWRVDNSYTKLEPGGLTCVEHCHEKPLPSAHSYGASGHGEYRNKLKEPYASHLYFIIRNDERKSDLLMQTADTTWHAYNRYGGSSAYGTYQPLNPKPRALKMTYNRPMVTRDYRSINMLFGAEYPAIRWLEKNGFDVSYISGLDMATYQDEQAMMRMLTSHKVFLSVGHDEYWGGKQRKIVTDAIQKHGLHAMFWSGNEMFWKVRFEEDAHDRLADQSGFGNQRMVIMKETMIRSEKLDKSSHLWTGTWRDEHPAFMENEQGPHPENAVTGQLYTVNVWRSDPIHVPWYFARHRFWRHCKEINTLNIGDDAFVLKKPLIGHEFDEDIDNGFRPKGLQHLSQTTIDNVHYILNWGTMYGTGSGQHHFTLYRHPESDALVFGAGTVMFSWGLDAHHDSATGIPPDLENYYSTRVVKDGYGEVKELQQAMFNLFADMNVNTPQTMDQESFVFEKDSCKLIGSPVSWVSEDTSKKDGNAQQMVKDGLRCIRIEGGSTVKGDIVTIIAGIEILMSNETESDREDKRWYAAVIDYNKIGSIYSDVADIKEWYWFFEAWIDVDMNTPLFAMTRAVNDHGQIEDVKHLEYTKIDLTKVNPCVTTEWTWRKRPHLFTNLLS